MLYAIKSEIYRAGRIHAAEYNLIFYAFNGSLYIFVPIKRKKWQTKKILGIFGLLPVFIGSILAGCSAEDTLIYAANCSLLPVNAYSAWRHAR
jgi:hypothetical protein